MILEVKSIHTYYGASHILFGVSLCVNSDEIFCLLGRNGSGKTTTMRSVIGLTPPKLGEIIFNGEDITGSQPYKIANKGIGYVPAERELFGDLTVRQNLIVAIKKGYRDNLSTWNLERVYDLFPILMEREHQMASSLSGGEQQMLSMARALMGNPNFLLLDEPTTGLSPLVIENVTGQVIQLRKEGLSVLLAEANMKFAMAVADRCLIIDKGQVRFQGSMEDVQKDIDLASEYLAV